MSRLNIGIPARLDLPGHCDCPCGCDITYPYIPATVHPSYRWKYQNACPNCAGGGHFGPDADKMKGEPWPRRMMRESDHHPHVPAERAELFQAADAGTTEDEYLGLLSSLVHATKPLSILETGTYLGAGTQAIASAMREVAMLVTIDTQPQPQAVEKIQALQMSERVKFVQAKASEYLAQCETRFDFAFFDSDLRERCNECRICLDRGLLLPGAYCAFHDTSAARTWGGKPDPAAQVFREQWNALKLRFREYIEFPLSRGLILARV